MNIFDTPQWILIFFIYAFLGWVWETGQKWIKTHHFINRGFLNGPWLPIYGFGALIILFLTLPFKDQIPLIFLVGMLAGTAFELFIGWGMEKIFHMRYWDYSSLPFNYKGYICLGASLIWGFFSILLVQWIDAPIYHLVKQIPVPWLYLIDAIALILFISDTVLSVIQALDLKHILRLDKVLVDPIKALKKAEKILKRNPGTHSRRYRLGQKEIRELIDQYRRTH
ncbi:hypothetical protein BN3662_00359 [Clostridiales bacterium CHKCI006]|nr:hypothetical protein BN3662_00359 [Clostridiales bacterium CHKCI006]